MNLPKNVTVYSGGHKISGLKGQKLPEHISTAIKETEADHDSKSSRFIGKKPVKFADVIKSAEEKPKDAKPEEIPVEPPAEPPAPQRQSFNQPGGQNK